MPQPFFVPFHDVPCLFILSSCEEELTLAVRARYSHSSFKILSLTALLPLYLPSEATTRIQQFFRESGKSAYCSLRDLIVLVSSFCLRPVDSRSNQQATVPLWRYNG